MMEACGFSDIERIPSSKLFRRIDDQTTMSFEDIYSKKTRDSKKQQIFQSSLN